jgi:hypothetical protein
MNNGKLTVIIFGIIGGIIALLICWLGIWMFLQETDTHTSTYFFAGIAIKGKTLAAILIWLGLVLIFYCIRKMIKYLKAV